MAGPYAWITDRAPGVTINGLDLLANFAALPVSMAPLKQSPAPRGSDYVVPQAHGVRVRPNKRYDGKSNANWKLMVKGTALDGTIPALSTPEGEWEKRLDALEQLLYSADTLIIGRTQNADGEIRWLNCVLNDTIAPAVQTGQRPLVGVMTVPLLPTSPFWYDSDVNVPAPVSGSLLTGGVLNLTSFEGATAPMTNIVAQFGAGNNPSLVQGNTFFTYGGVIPTGSTLLVDFGNWSCTAGPGTAWTPDLSLISYSDPGYWFVLDAWPEPLAVVLNHTTGSGKTMALTISGRRSYTTG